MIYCLVFVNIFIESPSIFVMLIIKGKTFIKHVTKSVTMIFLCDTAAV